ncbi:hypothetical protein LCGC14_2039480, partial [marine sediment metagenome]
DTNNVHKSVLKILGKYNLIKHLSSPLQRAKVKGKDKDTVKDTVKDKEINVSFDEFWKTYAFSVAKDDCRLLWEGEKKTKGKKGFFINDEIRSKIMNRLPDYVDSTYKNGEYPGRMNPKTYLNNKGWEDEVPETKQKFNTRNFEWVSNARAGGYIAYCTKCGKKELPPTKTLLYEGSSCCHVEYSPVPITKPGPQASKSDFKQILQNIEENAHE